MTVASLQLDAATPSPRPCCTTCRKTAASRSRDRAAASATRSRGSSTASRSSRSSPGWRPTSARATSRPGREPAQDVPRHGRGHPRRDHQAGRPAAQHAHARRQAAGEAACASRRRRWRSTRRWPTAWASGRSSGSSKTSPSATCEPEKYKQIAELIQSKRDRARDATSTQVEKILSDELEKQRHPGRTHGPREAHLLHLRRRWRSTPPSTRASSRSTTCWRSACSSTPSATATTRSASCTALWRPMPGPVRRLHRQPEGEPLPVAAHDGHGARRAAAGDPDPHPRDAPLAEYGVAAHWRYKEGGAQRRRPLRRAHGLAAPAAGLAARHVARRRSSSSRSRRTSSRTRSSSSRPKGEIKELPAGATPIDFAYRIHTDVGHHCVGAQGQRPAGAAELPAAERRRRRDRHGKTLARARRATGSTRTSATSRPATRARRSASGSRSRSATRTSSAAAR